MTSSLMQPRFSVARTHLKLRAFKLRNIAFDPEMSATHSQKLNMDMLVALLSEDVQKQESALAHAKAKTLHPLQR